MIITIFRNQSQPIHKQSSSYMPLTRKQIFALIYVIENFAVEFNALADGQFAEYSSDADSAVGELREALKAFSEFNDFMLIPVGR